MGQVDMKKAKEIEGDIGTIISTTWSKRTGNKVPETEDIALAGGAVELDATFLYADLASSSKMVKELDRRVAAKILKSFLSSSAKLIKFNNGKVVSYDGDRVLGVFYGKSKNSDSAICALQINYVVNQIIKPTFEAKYTSVKEASFSIGHGVGVDTGTVLAVRGGVRGSNDLIWIERAPNLAAKLSDLRESPLHSFITASVYNRLNDKSKLGGKEEKIMWQARTWKFLEETIIIYGSSWWWRP